ncbi:MAG: hypothetical protein ACR2QK_24020 [Acidimicrobiales bacterium]
MSSIFPFPNRERSSSTAPVERQLSAAKAKGAAGRTTGGANGGLGRDRTEGNGTRTGAGGGHGADGSSGDRKAKNGSRSESGRKRNGTRPNGRRTPVSQPASTKPPRETVTGNRGEPIPETELRPPRQPSRVEQLEDRVERLSVVCEAMWDMLSQEVGLELEQLAARVEEMSPVDGPEQQQTEQRRRPLRRTGDKQKDAQDPESRTCPDCGEAMTAESKVCLFCSARSTDPAAWTTLS